MMNKKAQTALEYMMIVALALGIILPTTYLFFRHSSESNSEIIDSKIGQIGREMINSAETVYFSGEGSKLVVEFIVPDEVSSVYIIDNIELVFNISTPYGEIDSVFFSDVNLTSLSCTGNICDLSDDINPGLNRIRFLSFNGGKEVLITKLE